MGGRAWPCLKRSARCRWQQGICCHHGSRVLAAMPLASALSPQFPLRGAELAGWTVGTTVQLLVARDARIRWSAGRTAVLHRSINQRQKLNRIALASQPSFFLCLFQTSSFCLTKCNSRSQRSRCRRQLFLATVYVRRPKRSLERERTQGENTSTPPRQAACA